MLNVIYEDKDKIIVNKPAGQLSQSARGFDMDLVSEVLTYRKNKGEEAYAAIINRLDRPVSGLVLIAKNKKEAARLSALMQRESLCKQYLVLVCGRPHSDTGTFTDYLLKNTKCCWQYLFFKQFFSHAVAIIHRKSLGNENVLLIEIPIVCSALSK